MSEELKKIVSVAISTGAIVSSAVYGISKPDCDFVVVHEGKEICVSSEIKQILENELPVSQGFGGIKFK